VFLKSSSLLINGPNKLYISLSLDRKDILGTNTPAYWTHFYGTKKIKRETWPRDVVVFTNLFQHFILS
jgi:hypothetical protein